MIALVAVVAVLAAQLVVTLVWLKRWKEVHHGYIGIALAVFGVIVGWQWLVMIGGIILADDAMQHLIQLRWPHSRASLLWGLYAITIAKWQWVERLNHWLDQEDA